MDWKKLISNKRIKKSKPTDFRNEFESDYGRIIYSHALRRMHDKTQVFPLTTDDNIHSRLTHSNEVMSLGYSFGLNLSKSKIIQHKTSLSELELIRILPVLMQNICLIHDIGNAPFGHFGETIVSDYFTNLEKTGNARFKALDPWQKRDFFNYDGNAQGLRVLTKLQYLDNPFGLNLTYATLAAFLKYPNSDEINDNVKKELKKKSKSLEEKFIEKEKHGIFFSEKEYYDMIVAECGLEQNKRVLRHPLCYLMEAADSIAYLCMDVEDGFHTGLVDIPYLKKIFQDNKSEVSKKIISICDDTYLNPITKIVAIRIKLIGYFVALAYDNFEKNLSAIEIGKYNIELIKDDDHKVYKVLRQCCIEKIFCSRDINYLESTGYAVFKGLLDFYVTFLFHDNWKYVNRAKSLISKSIIDAAIEENLIGIAANKKMELKTEDRDILESNLAMYKQLFQKQITEELEGLEREILKKVRFEILETVNPEFEDLSDYFKFRVILDFISGMTDQFALNHYQKLSGQKII
jgi:dGTPase